MYLNGFNLEINHVVWYNIYWRNLFTTHVSAQHSFSIIVYLDSYSVNFLLK
jgi:hypothetical protein